MRIRTFLLSAALIVATAGLMPAMASPWAEVGDNQLRSDLELLQAAGVIDTVTTHWPLPWRSITVALQRAPLAAQPAAVRAVAERVMARAHAASDPGWRASSSADATNLPSVVYGFDGMGRGKGQAQVSLEGIGGGFAGRISLGGFTQDFHGRTFKLMPEGTYFSADLGGARIYGGYLDHWWGGGQISALAVSNNARPMPQVGIERASTSASSLPVLKWLGPWQAEFLLGYLDGPRLQTDTYYSALRVTLHPLQGLEFALSRTEEFCGQTHTCSPIKDYFQFSNNPTSINNTNDQLTFDFKYSGLLGHVPVQAYLQWMNEDYSWFNHSISSHLFGLSGWIPTGGASPIKLTAEFTDSISSLHPFSFGDDVFGASYTNSTYLDGMRYRGRTLGLSLDDDSTLASLQASWSDPAGRFYELTLHHATIGTSHTPLGANIVSAAPVLLNLAEARIVVPWRGLRLEIAGRVQDDQPRPHSGFAAALEVGMRVNM